MSASPRDVARPPRRGFRRPAASLVAATLCAVLCAAGVGWVLWLLASAPQVDAITDHPERCYSTFQVPVLPPDPTDVPTDSTAGRHYDDQAVRNGLRRDDLEEAVRVADDCQRVRSYHQALATMVSIPTVLAGATAVILIVAHRTRVMGPVADRPDTMSPRPSGPRPLWDDRTAH